MNKKAAWPIAITVILVGAYFGVTYLVREHVNQVIAASHGKSLPDFELSNRQGVEHRRKELAGKVAVLHFMRSKCVSCEHERPFLKQFAAGLDSSQVVLWSVMMDPVMGFPESLTEDTLQRFDLQHPVLMADPEFVDAFHGVGWAKVTPVTYFADRSGKIVTSLRGHQTLESLRDALRLAEQSGLE